MKSHAVGIGLALAVAAGLAAVSLTAEVSAQTAPAARDFDAEIRASLVSAKRAAGFEFLGTPQSDLPGAAERRRKHQ